MMTSERQPRQQGDKRDNSGVLIYRACSRERDSVCRDEVMSQQDPRVVHAR